MKNRQKCETLFKQIAEGFNLTEGEITETLQLPSEGLKNAIKECFQQIQNPRQYFIAEDYAFLTDELGCVNLEDALSTEPLSEIQTPEHIICSILFTQMPLRFTYSMLMSAVYPVLKDADDTALQILELFSHPNVKILVKEQEYYAFNPNAKIN